MIFLSPWIGTAANPWTDFPYSPLLWGTAFVLGLVVNVALRDRSAKWPWTIGVLWLGYHLLTDLKWYDPRWCNGCSAAQFVWYNYFSYSNSMQEGLGLMLATSPMLNSVAYSVGAALGQRLKGSAGQNGTQMIGVKSR